MKQQRPPSQQPRRWCRRWTAVVAAIVTLFSATDGGGHAGATGRRVYTAPLDDTGRTAVYWTVDYGSRSVKFEAHFAAGGGPFDWLAVGFSGRGNHSGADFCVMWVDWKGVTGMLVSVVRKGACIIGNAIYTPTKYR